MDLHLNPTWALARDYSAYGRARYKGHVGRIDGEYTFDIIISTLNQPKHLFYKLTLGDMAIPRTVVTR